jgi:hypothetical protein
MFSQDNDFASEDAPRILEMSKYAGRPVAIPEIPWVFVPLGLSLSQA